LGGRRRRSRDRFRGFECGAMSGPGQIQRQVLLDQARPQSNRRRVAVIAGRGEQLIVQLGDAGAVDIVVFAAIQDGVFD